jgi:putative colanic acid biosynthesis acetyltransferase WcaF
LGSDSNVSGERDKPSTSLDIAANRAAQKWTPRELMGRALWELLRGPLFAWTPRPLWGWRRGVLRLFGAKIGRNAHVHPSARIVIPWNLELGEFAAVGDRAIVYNLGPVSIGSGTTISQNAHLCAGTHDYRRSDMPLVKATIRIEEGVWICADAFIGPNVTVGRLAIIGARAVAMRDIEERAIVVGNPARVIGQRPEPRL